jgi:hypothetical protein
MSHWVARSAVVVVATLVCCSGCGEPRQVDRQLKRPPLSLLSSKGSTTNTRAVEPGFREFSELTAGIAPERHVLQPQKRESGPRTETFFFPEHENNNVAERATAVSLPAELHGHMDPLIDVPAGDEDWYSFLVERDRPGVMDLELTGVTKLDLAVEIYYDAFRGRTRLLKVNNQGRGQGERLPNVSLPNGRYYVRVLQEVTEERPARSDVVRPYKLLLTSKELSATDETEPNDTALTAIPLSLDEQMSGLVNRHQDEDWYSLDLLKVSALSRLTVELLPPMETTLELAIFTQTHQELMALSADGGKRLFLPNLRVFEGSGGYLFRVRSTEPGMPKDAYGLKVANLPLEERVELEPDNHAESAHRILWDVPLSGWLSHAGDVDWFHLEPNHEWGEDDDGKPTQPALHLVLGGVPGVDLELEIYDADQESLIARYDVRPKGEGEEAPNLAVPERTTYIKVSAAQGDNAGAQYVLEAQAITTDGMEVEPNNTPEEPTVIATMGEELKGFLSPRGDRDCFRFEQPQLTLRYKEAPEGTTTVSAYDATGALYFQRRSGDSLLEIPPSAGALTVCLELTGEVKLSPRAPYFLMRHGVLPIN